MMPPLEMQGTEPRAVRWFVARRNQGLLGWRGTDALARGALCGLGLVAVGLVLHQPALLLLGTPLLASAVLGAVVPGAPKVTIRPRPRAVEEGNSDLLTATIDPGARAELVAIRLPSSGGGGERQLRSLRSRARRRRPGAGVPQGTVTSGVGRVHLLPASATTVRTRIRWEAWGEAVELRADHLIAGPDGLIVYGPVVGLESRRMVLPPVSLVRPGPLPPRTAGLVGVHRSPRPGDGTELRDIRPFQAGDRLRRVDWRVSLRAAASVGGELVPGTLHVRERHAETDGELMLALDTRVDVGSDLGEWSKESVGVVRDGGSLDVGVRAVAALAASYLRQGDRVGLVDLGSPRLGVRPGSGYRQLERIRHQLVTCGRNASWTARPVLRAEQIPHGAAVLVLSTFLDDAVADLAVRATRRGNLVVGIDLLPHPLSPQRDTPWGDAVLRMLLTERRIRLNAMRTNGIATVAWGDSGALAGVLRRARRRRGVLAG